MTDKISQFISWRVVASAICVLILAMAGSLWSGHENRLAILDKDVKERVTIGSYNIEMEKIDKKLDLIINMHMERAK